MNNTFQHWFTLACAAGGIACISAILLYAARNQLRVLFDRWLALGRLGQCVSVTMLTAFVLYGGSKAPTNAPPDSTGGDTSSTNNPPPTMMVMLPPQTEINPPPSTSTFNLNLITNWHARGAWIDWTHIQFPDGFAFPSGTNLLTGVTLMSYGELRESLRGQMLANITNQLPATGYQLSPTNYQLPATNYQLSPLSLQPGVSSVSYGLTPSNTFVFAWENACIDRSATNRVNASIELFQSGVIALTTASYQLSATNSLPSPTTNYLLPALPPGFVGEGQDVAWATNAFPAFAEVAEWTDYEAWLSDVLVGYDDPNGIYKVSVTVEALPAQGPCYLVVGPYRVVVKQPGTYSFPLEVFETYKAYTCPTRVPLSFAYDHGFSDPEASFLASPPPAPLLAGMSPQDELEYELRQIPPVYVTPKSATLSSGESAVFSIRANIANAVLACRTLAEGFRFTYLSQTEAEIIMAASDAIIEFELSNGKGRATGYASLYYRPTETDPSLTNDVGSTTHHHRHRRRRSHGRHQRSGE